MGRLITGLTTAALIVLPTAASASLLSNLLNCPPGHFRGLDLQCHRAGGAYMWHGKRYYAHHNYVPPRPPMHRPPGPPHRPPGIQPYK